MRISLAFLLIFAATLGWSQQRMIPHVTSPDGGFTTQLILANTIDSQASYMLTGYSTDGTETATAGGVLSAFSNLVIDASVLLGPETSYVLIDEGAVEMTAVYRRDRPDAGVAHVGETDRQSTAWRIFAGDPRVTWDGIALVNMGDAAAEISITQNLPNGLAGETVILHEALPARAKLLDVLSATFERVDGGWYDVVADQPLGIIALRGNLNSDFLWRNEAIAIDPPRVLDLVPFATPNPGPLTDFRTAPGGDERVFMTALFGRIWVFPDASGTGGGQVFMDIGPRVIAGGESGLFGIAFHPNFTENGYFYLSYTTPEPLRSRISRFQVDPENPNRGLEDSEVVIFEVEQPDPRHNAGQIQFGADGYLYYALGDGGIPNDPAFPAQDLTNLFGSLLRIDVDNPDEGMAYGIPESNPFAGNAEGFREEIFSYGLRNTWRFSIDHHDGVTRIWGSDVGASRVEEINLLVAGGNYGWSVVEGELCFDPRVDCVIDESFIPPIWSYDHNEDGASITGGYVYRGEAIPELYGDFIYGDYVTGEIWALTYDGVNPPSNRLILSIPRQSLTAFGQDARGELYVLTVTGEVYRIE